MISVCKNCKGRYIEGDKYCRFCGAPLGEPLYIDEKFACVYGPPPITRTHTCKKCKYSWETHLMADNQRHCPKCGGKAPVVAKDEHDLDIIKETLSKWKNKYGN